MSIMKKALAATALTAGALALVAAPANAEELTVDGGYGSLEACDVDGAKGTFTYNGQELTGDQGWRYRCDQGADGAWYMTIFR